MFRLNFYTDLVDISVTNVGIIHRIIDFCDLLSSTRTCFNQTTRLSATNDYLLQSTLFCCLVCIEHFLAEQLLKQNSPSCEEASLCRLSRHTKINELCPKMWSEVTHVNIDPANDHRARNLWYFGSKCYHVFSFATGIFMW